MHIRVISYTKKKNLGNYENVEVGCTLELDEGVDENTAFKEVKRFVNRKLDKEESSDE